MMANRNDEAQAIPPRWYSVTKYGLATLCLDEGDARATAAESDKLYPHHAPHTAVCLTPRPEPAGRDKSAKTHKDGRDKSPDLHKDVTPGVTLVDFYGWRGKIVNHREAAEAAAHAPQEGAE